MVKDGTNAKLYIDGVLVQNSNNSFDNNTYSVSRIGNYGSNSQGAVGIIDEVKIYPYARTSAQIAWDYNRGKPVAHWKMDECEGETIHDSSGNENHGMWNGSGGGTQTSVGTCQTTGTAWGNGADGKFNASLNFDGVDDYVEIPSNSIFSYGTGDFSWSLWAKASNLPSNSYVIDHGVNGGLLQYHSGDLKYYNFSSGYINAGALQTGRWYHILVVRNSGVTFIYLDGEFAVSSADTYNYPVQKVTIGDYGGHGVYNWNGQIDDVQIFNYALSEEQVKLLYNGGASLRFGS